MKSAFVTCSDRAKFRLCKLIPHGNHNTRSPKYKNKNKVYNHGYHATVETVVQPRDK